MDFMIQKEVNVLFFWKLGSKKAIMSYLKKQEKESLT